MERDVKEPTKSDQTSDTEERKAHQVSRQEFEKLVKDGLVGNAKLIWNHPTKGRIEM